MLHGEIAVGWGQHVGSVSTSPDLQAHQRTPLVERHVAYDGFDNYRGELFIIYRIHANHGWFLRKCSSLAGIVL